MKVLHVVENLDRSAVESWLLRMLRHAKSRNVSLDWTFYCTLGEPGRLDEAVRDAGARVVRSPVPIAQKTAFVRALRAELKRGRYDVLHAHHDLVSAVYLLAAAGLPIRRRIVHVHNQDEALPTPRAIKRAVFTWAFRHTCLLLADRIVGISKHTLSTFVKSRARPGVDVVHYYGIAAGPYECVQADRVAFRRGLAVDEHARILLFAGRLVPEKNPLFVVEVLAELHKLDPKIVGVFAGSGSLEGAVRQRAAELGIEPHCRHLGWRDDIPAIMACSDCFILPHPEQPKEGFGIAVVEAQLAGLPLLLSTGIPDDPLLPTARFSRLPLSAGPAAWATAAAELMAGPAPSRAEAAAALKASPMDLDRALQGLIALHA